MAITPRYGWEIADGPDAPNVPFALTELATDIEETIGGLEDAAAAVGLNGTHFEAALADVTTDAMGLALVGFTYTFAYLPIVLLTVASPGVTAARLVSESLTTSYAQIQLLTGTGVPPAGTYKIHWMAIGGAV